MKKKIIIHVKGHIGIMYQLESDEVHTIRTIDTWKVAIRVNTVTNKRTDYTNGDNELYIPLCEITSIQYHSKGV